MTRPVSLECLLVPDGAEPSSGGATLRLSLVLSLGKDPGPSSPFSLETLPDDIVWDRANGRGRQVTLALTDVSGRIIDSRPFDLAEAAGRSDGSGDPEATRLWAIVLGADPGAVHAFLQPVDAGAGRVALKAALPVKKTLHESFAYSSLARVLHQLHLDEAVGDVVAALGATSPSLRKELLAGVADPAAQRACAQRFDNPLDSAWRTALWRDYSGEQFGMRPLGNPGGGYATTLRQQGRVTTGEERPSQARRSEYVFDFVKQRVRAKLADRQNGREAAYNDALNTHLDHQPPGLSKGLDPEAFWESDKSPPGSGGAPAEISLPNILQVAPKPADGGDPLKHPEKTPFQLALMDRALTADTTQKTPDGASPFVADDTAANDAITRRFAALEAHPSLRKLLNLIIDLEWPLDAAKANQLAGATGGCGVVSMESEQLFTSAKTAFIFQQTDSSGASDTSGAVLTFEPCGRATLSRAIAWPTLPQIDRGVLNLREEWQGRRRYHLDSLDTIGSAFKMQSASNAHAEQEQQGGEAGTVDLALPEFQSRGIMLMDRAASDERQMRSMMAQNPPPEPKFAEDLLSGYRVDVVYDDPQHGPQAFPITGRLLDYPQYTFGDWRRQDRFRARDDGFVQSGARIVPAEPGAEHDQSHISTEVMFTWSGENLGIPGPLREGGKTVRRIVQASPDLAVDMTYALPPISGALRIGMPYRIGLRARKPNGGSIELSAAERLYDDCALGVPGDQTDRDDSAIYRVADRTKAPDILAPGPGAIRGLTDLYASLPLAERPGESDAVVVVRSGQVLRRSDEMRVLMPTKIDRDRAELFRMFDGPDVDPLVGAYRDVMMDRAGNYPARGDSSDPSQAPMRIFVGGGGGQRREAFYPDPVGRMLGAALSRDGRSLDSFQVEPPKIGFWKGDPLDATPIYLRLRRWAKPSGAYITSRPQSGQPIDGPELVVDLGEAEEVDLTLWTYDDWSQTEALQLYAHGVLHMLRVMGLTSAAANVVESWSNCVALVPAPALHQLATVRLVHALDRPRSPARVKSMTPIPTTGKTSGPGSWADIVARAELDLPVGPTGAAVYFTGELGFDRPATGAVRIELKWLEIESAPLVNLKNGAAEPEDAWPHDPAEKPSWAFAPRFEPWIRTIDNIPRVDSDDASAAVLDLFRDEAGKLRNLSKTFDSSVARRLVVRTVATSRFLPYLPPLPPQPANPKSPDETGAEGPYDREDVSREQVVRQLYNPGLFDSAPSSALATEVWVPASAAPPAPTRSQPRHAQHVTEKRVGNQLLATWRCPIRIPLKDWPNSEGVLAAIVCWPPDLFDQRTAHFDPARPARYLPNDAGPTLGEKARIVEVQSAATKAAFDKLPRWLTDVVTQWAGDPTLASKPPPLFITPDRFSGYVASARELKLVKGNELDPTAPPDASIPVCAPELVSIVAYEPLFDSETGDWYCDVFLDPEPAYAPLVRFGLARYQPHSLLDCELSSAIGLDEIVVPSKRDIVLTKEGGVLTATVRGAVFTDRATALQGALLASHEEKAMIRNALAPQMRFQLYRMTPGGPVDVGFEQIAAPLTGDVWTARFDISRWPTEQTFSVLIEEFTLEGLALASFRPDSDGRLVERKLLFAYRGTI